MKAVVILAAAGALALPVSGCHLKTSSPSTESSGSQTANSGGSSDASQSSTDPSVRLAEGRKVYDSKCARCHAINGEGGSSGSGGFGGPGGERPSGPGRPGGRGWGKGPDLGHIGVDHTADWIADHVRDPRKHKQLSTMPKFSEEKISETDLKALAEYLASLK